MKKGNDACYNGQVYKVRIGVTSKIGVRGRWHWNVVTGKVNAHSTATGATTMVIGTGKFGKMPS
jgi:hypothetical protein